MNQGNYSAAFDLYQRMADGRYANLGKRDPETLEAYNNLAITWSVLHVLGIRPSDNLLYSHFNKQYETIVENVSLCELFRHLLTIRESCLGNDHPDTLKTAISYADLMHNKMELEEAKKMYERVLKAREKGRWIVISNSTCCCRQTCKCAV